MHAGKPCSGDSGVQKQGADTLSCVLASTGQRCNIHCGAQGLCSGAKRYTQDTLSAPDVAVCGH